MITTHQVRTSIYGIIGFLLISTLLIVNAANLSEEQYQGLFQKFGELYGKQYETNDLAMRFQLFKENLNFIMDWNANKDNTHTVGVNFFTDMTPEEWVQFKGLIVPSNYQEPQLVNSDDLSNTDLPEDLKNTHVGEGETWDWESAGKVAPVRNQFSCGSCYSQTAVTTVESAYAIKYDTEPPVLSVQQAVDCSGGKYGNQGCMGGWMMWVYKYFIDTGGVCTEEDYPYRNRKQTCRTNQCERQAQITSYVNISGQSENTMLKATALTPLSIAVTSNTREFMFYKTGIINYCGNPRATLDHAVTLIGYGTSDSGTDYWLVRNSWGSQWGEDGNVRIIRNKNMCKIRSNVSYPVIETVGDAGYSGHDRTTPAGDHHRGREPAGDHHRGRGPAGGPASGSSGTGGVSHRAPSVTDLSRSRDSSPTDRGSTGSYSRDSSPTDRGSTGSYGRDSSPTGRGSSPTSRGGSIADNIRNRSSSSSTSPGRGGSIADNIRSRSSHRGSSTGRSVGGGPDGYSSTNDDRLGDEPVMHRR